MGYRCRSTGSNGDDAGGRDGGARFDAGGETRDGGRNIVGERMTQEPETPPGGEASTDDGHRRRSRRLVDLANAPTVPPEDKGGESPSRDGGGARRSPPEAAEPSGSEPVEFRPGDRLGGYEIGELVGRGGMGDVYRATDLALRRKVAIKILPAELARQSEFVHRFYAEASAAARLSHPHIIRIYQIAEEQGRHFFVMPFVEGGSLAGRLRRETRLAIPEASRLVSEVLDGLGAAHAQGMIHRDIKPGNILLDRHSRAVVADFGLVKLLAEGGGGRGGGGGGQRTITGVILGSVDYMSPEQGRGQPVDGRSDLYSVGVLLYQMLSGSLPFSADSPTGMIFQHVYEKPVPLPKRVPEVLPALWAVVARLLAKNPAKRYSSSAAVLDDLVACRENRPLPSGTHTQDFDEFWRPLRTISRQGQSGLLVCEPEFAADPVVPDGLQLRWWQKLLKPLVDAWRARSPAFLDRLSKTQRQVDSAVSEYAARAKQLRAYVREAESILGDLRSQQPHTSEVEAIAQLVSNQEEQLAAMRLRLARIETTLETLRSQRDLLDARLEAAHRRLGRTGARRSVRRIAGLAGIILAASGIGAVVVNGILFRLALREHQRPAVAPVVPSSGPAAIPFTTKVLASPAASHRLSPAVIGEMAGLHFDSGKAWILNRGGLHSLAVFDGPDPAIATDAGLSAGSWRLPPNTGLAVRDPVPDQSPAVPEIELRDLSLSQNIRIGLDGLTGFRAGRIDANPIGLAGVGRRGSEFALLEASPTGSPRLRPLAASPQLDGLAVSASGTWIVGRDEGGFLTALRAANVSEPSESRRFPAPTDLFALAPATDVAAVAGKGASTVALWDLARGRTRAELDCQAKVQRLAFDATARKLAVASADRVRIWDLQLGFLRIVLPVADCRELAFALDGESLATLQADGTLQVWPTLFPSFTLDRQGGATGSPSASPTSKSPKVLISKEGYRLTLDKDLGVRLLHGRTGQVLVRYGHLSGPISVALSPDNRRVAIGTMTRAAGSAIEVFDFFSGRRLVRTRDFPGGPNDLDFSPDGKTLVSCGEGVVQIWDAAALVERVRASKMFGTRCRFSPDGEWVVAFDTGQLQRSNVVLARTGEQLLQLTQTPVDWAFETPDGRGDPTFGRWRTIASSPAPPPSKDLP